MRCFGMSEPSIAPEVQPVTRRTMRHRMLVKLGTILVVALVLLIPLGLLVPVVEDRALLRTGAVQDIERGWGQEQTIIGPVLVIPTDHGIAYAFPDELKVTAGLAPEQRRRGIGRVTARGDRN